MNSYYSDEEDGNIDGLWTFNPNAGKEEASDEQRKEEMMARKRSRDILENM